jgi:hypothetical protein
MDSGAQAARAGVGTIQEEQFQEELLRVDGAWAIIKATPKQEDL